MDDLRARIPWAGIWCPLPDDTADRIERELRREMCKGHVLYGRKVTAIGFAKGSDDTLFSVDDAPPQVAVVHLTWRKETRTDHPSVRTFDSIEDWIELCLVPNERVF